MTTLFAMIDEARAAVDARAAQAGGEVICHDHDTITTDAIVSHMQCPGCIAAAERARAAIDDEADSATRMESAWATGRWGLLDFGGPDGCAVPTWDEINKL